MLACNCLNVVIEIQSNDFQKVNAEALNLTTEELKDAFFKQDIQQVGKLININKVHSGLIETRNVGCWVIHYCINCDVHSHAVHRDKGAACILVNTKLLNTDAIERLRCSDMFSQLFNIIVNPHKLDDNDDKLSASQAYMPNDIEPVVKGLKQIASEALKQEALAVEERIKKYTEEQYNQLDVLRERAFREQQALIRIILNNINDNSNKPDSTNSTMSKSIDMPSRLNEPLAALNDPKSPIRRHAPKRQKSSPGGVVNSFETETLLFEFDGIDDIPPQDGSELEESDGDELTNREDSGVKMSRTRKEGSVNVIARSLPMNIPTFLSQNNNRANEDVDDFLPTDEKLDIAASIKALAKSVHGDTVFGDLPRPRFSTQI